MKLWTGCAVIALVASLALVGCGKKEGSGSVSVDTSSAKATMETVARAVKQHDGEAIAACLPPDLKDTMGPMMVSLMDAMGKADSLRKTCVDKFGKDVTDKAMKDSEGMSKNGPFSGGIKDDGSIDWNKTKVTEKGDIATVEVEGKPAKDALKKINGKWCLQMEGMTAEKAKKEGAKGVKMAKGMGDAFESVEKQVKDGKVGKDDLEKALSDAMMKVMTEAMKDAPKTD